MVDIPTLQEICAWLPHDASPLVLTSAFTGMRWGEICGMRRSYLTLHPAQGERPEYGHYNVDPVLGAVHETVRAHRYYGPPKTVLKNGNGREIDLPPFLVELLIDFVAAMGERDLLSLTAMETGTATPTGCACGAEPTTAGTSASTSAPESTQPESNPCARACGSTT